MESLLESVSRTGIYALSGHFLPPISIGFPKINRASEKWRLSLKISIIVQGRLHAFDLAREFSKRGHLHQIITTFPRFVTSKFGIPAENVTSLTGFEVIRRLSDKLPLSQQVRDAFEVRRLAAFAKNAAILLEPCDVLIALSSVGAPAFRKAEQWNTLRICERGSSHVLEQERLLSEEHRLKDLPWIPWSDRKRQIELDDYQLADMIEIPSLFVKRSFIKQGFEADRLIYSPYGTDLTTFKPAQRQSDDSFRVIFSGSLSLRKGVGYLEQAFLDADLPNSELWLVGQNTEETPRVLNSQDKRIKILGWMPQDQLPGIYSQADVFVLPSIEDGFGLVLVQALSCGLPLITTTNTGGEDLLRLNGEEGLQIDEDILQYPAGFVVPIRRPDCIAHCLRLLYENRDLREKMRHAALLVSSQKLDWSYRVDGLIKVYETHIRRSQ